MPAFDGRRGGAVGVKLPYTPTISDATPGSSITSGSWSRTDSGDIEFSAKLTLGVGFVGTSTVSLSLPVASTGRGRAYAAIGRAGVNTYAGFPIIATWWVSTYLIGPYGAATPLFSQWTWNVGDTLEITGRYPGAS